MPCMLNPVLCMQHIIINHRKVHTQFYVLLNCGCSSVQKTDIVVETIGIISNNAILV